MKEVRYNIGGLNIEFDLKDYPVKFIAPVSYEKFLTHERTRPDARYRLHIGKPNLDANKKNILIDSKSLWKIEEMGEKFAIKIDRVGSLSRICVIDKTFTSGDIYIYDSRGGHTNRKSIMADEYAPIGYPLDQIIISNLLQSNNGVLLHAFGLQTNNKGLLFVGQSGSGKSTSAGIWKRSGKILNDDRVVLRKLGGRYYLFGTPWSGDYKGNCASMVTADYILFIKHGLQNRLSKLDMTDAVIKLLSNCFSAFWTPGHIKKRISICNDTVKSLDCYEFAFTPEKILVEFLRRHLLD